MSWDIDLNGETALVIGGTCNIGLSIAEALQSAGASVCIVGGSDQTALEAALERLKASGDRSTGLIADIRNETAVSTMFESCEKVFGPASIVVNGPGFRPHAPFTDIDLETWNAVLSTMLTGLFDLSRIFSKTTNQSQRGYR